ncbi:MAG: bifunctional oligoribonuclease/PAP phosphatase NrnA [Anaerolineales bacterium]|jgi:phosphoesterase RecJ-like protein
MNIKPESIKDLRKQVQRAQRILTVSHIRPDGDAVGSLLGLGLSLQAAGKEVQMVLEDGVPRNFRFLEKSSLIQKKPQGDFDLIIVVDCSDLRRVGGALDGYAKPHVNIDHHVTNLNFADFNIVDTFAVATAEILAWLLPELNLPSDHDVASALLTGLITDTIGFRTSNMTPEALRCAADLMEAGVDLSEIYNEALIVRSFEAARFWGAGLSKLDRDGSIVWTTLSMQDRNAVDYGGRDDADLINLLSSIESADIALIFVEQPNGNTKVSWRAKPGFDVSSIALRFGGGGHPAASGAEIPGSIEEVSRQVLNETRKLVNGKVLQGSDI